MIQVLGEETEKAIVLVIVMRLLAQLLQLLLLELFILIHPILDLEAVLQDHFEALDNLHNVIVLRDYQLSILFQVSNCLRQLESVDVLAVSWTVRLLVVLFGVG